MFESNTMSLRGWTDIRNAGPWGSYACVGVSHPSLSRNTLPPTQPLFIFYNALSHQTEPRLFVSYRNVCARRFYSKALVTSVFCLWKVLALWGIKSRVIFSCSVRRFQQIKCIIATSVVASLAQRIGWLAMSKVLLNSKKRRSIIEPSFITVVAMLTTLRR